MAAIPKAGHTRLSNATLALAMLGLLAGCGGRMGGLDFDLRGNLGDAFDTSSAVQRQVSDRPEPDNRGIISYPSYQVAVARRGDKIGDVAARVGLPAQELASYNGLPLDVTLRRGEIVALPRRVAEPSPATGAETSGPIRPGPVTTEPLGIEERAADAIDRAEANGPRPAGESGLGSVSGEEPVRHKVARGETAYSIARRYDVPVEALAEWNGLPADYTVREGQYLLIPVAAPAPGGPAEPSRPGSGTRAPTPPSASEPLPEENITPGAPEAVPDSPDLADQATASANSGGRFAFPVQGEIIRPFQKGKNEGIDISASAGTTVKAVADGTVAAITRDTDQIPILVLRHSESILTVYAGVDAISVEKGDPVTRGQPIAEVRAGDPPYLHFEVRKGFDSVDPMNYLQ